MTGDRTDPAAKLLARFDIAIQLVTRPSEIT
jgi:hypothetical protein